MSPRPQPIDDAELSAWLDGELGPERRAEVDAWLHDHPEDAARVRLWAADGETLRASLAPLLDEPTPPVLAQAVLRRDRAGPAAWSPAWRWAAGIALFVLGGVAGAALAWRYAAPGMPLLAQAEPAWVARAAVAHAVYVPEVRHPVEVAAREEAHLAGWLTKRLDVPVKVFDLRAQGFELVGGRLLPDASGPSAQLMYQQVAGGAPEAGGAARGPVRVTVYVRKPDRATPAAFRYERQGDLGLFYWIEGAPDGAACGYALVGALPREQLLALAEAIYRQAAPAGR